MKKLLLLLISGAVLAVFNPGMSEFQSFVEERAAQRIEEKTGGGAIGRALAGAGAGFLGANVGSATDRTSYLVCSTYSVDPDGDGAAEWHFLGIAGQFVEVSAPDSE